MGRKRGTKRKEFGTPDGKRPLPVTTGIPGIDAALGGWLKPGALAVCEPGSRTPSRLVSQIADAAARGGCRVLFASTVSRRGMAVAVGKARSLRMARPDAAPESLPDAWAALHPEYVGNHVYRGLDAELAAPARIPTFLRIEPGTDADDAFAEISAMARERCFDAVIVDGADRLRLPGPRLFPFRGASGIAARADSLSLLLGVPVVLSASVSPPRGFRSASLSTSLAREGIANVRATVRIPGKPDVVVRLAEETRFALFRETVDAKK